MDFIENNKVDTFICDHRTDACIDAVYAKKLPMILTATLGMFAGKSLCHIKRSLPLTASMLVICRCLDELYKQPSTHSQRVHHQGSNSFSPLLQQIPPPALGVVPCEARLI